MQHSLKESMYCWGLLFFHLTGKSKFNQTKHLKYPILFYTYLALSPDFVYFLKPNFYLNCQNLAVVLCILITTPLAKENFTSLRLLCYDYIILHFGEFFLLFTFHGELLTMTSAWPWAYKGSVKYVFFLANLALLLWTVYNLESENSFYFLHALLQGQQNRSGGKEKAGMWWRFCGV